MELITSDTRRLPNTLRSTAIARQAAQLIAGQPLTVPLIVDGRMSGYLHSEAGIQGSWFAPLTSSNYMLTKLAAGQRRGKFWCKNATAFNANHWQDYWPVGGNPKQGSYTGAASTARQLDDTVDGGIPHGGNVSPSTKHVLSSMSVTQGYSVYGFIYDRVLTYEANTVGVVKVTMTNTLAAQRYVSAGQPGLLVMPTAQVQIAAAGAPGLSAMTYVNQAGTTGRVAPLTAADYQFDLNAPTPSTTMAALNQLIDSNSGPHLFVPLVAGDTGVRSITDYTCSDVTISGTFCFALVHPLVMFACSGSLNPCQFDYAMQWASLERVYDGAHLAVSCYVSSSVPGLVMGSLDFGWG